MDIHELRIFIKTAELLHFGNASRQCNLSPSALTRSIQRLEEDVGHPLFLRDNRSVALTETGKRFLAYARTAVQEWEVFQETVSDSDRVQGSLSLYASITAVYSLLPDLLETYRSRFPDVQLELRTGAAEQAVDEVLRGEMDLAVAARPDSIQGSLAFLPLAETPLVFIASKNQPIDCGAGWADIPLVVPQSGPARHRLLSWYKEQKLRPHIVSEVSGSEALIALVRLGTGVGVVPQLVLERSPFSLDVRVIENGPELSPYVVGLCATHRTLKRPAVRAMWDMAEAL